jgi:hypothetical protein
MISKTYGPAAKRFISLGEKSAIDFIGFSTGRGRKRSAYEIDGGLILPYFMEGTARGGRLTVTKWRKVGAKRLKRLMRVTLCTVTPSSGVAMPG